MEKIERVLCHNCNIPLSPGRCYFDNKDAKRVAFEALGERNFEDWGDTGYCCKSCYESGKEEFERKWKK